MTKTEDKILEAIGVLSGGMADIQERLGTLESADVPDVVAHDVAPVTRVKAIDDDTARLRLAVPKDSKAKFIDQCAEHSYDALQTLILAGSREARAFMAGEAQAATGKGEYGLVETHPNYAYACRLLETHEKLPVTAHSAQAKRPEAGMSDAQLLRFRPKDASTKAPARNAWLMRTRTKLS